MLSKNRIKHIISLKQKKFRQKYNFFIAEGNKICLDIISEFPKIVENIYALPEWISTNTGILEPLTDKVVAITPIELKKISGLKTPNQVLIIAEFPKYSIDEDALKNGFSLFLEDIQNPGNLGTILRIADWFGIKHVFLSKGTVDIFNQKVIQASMSSFLRINIIEEDLHSLKERFPNIPILATTLDGKNIFEISNIRIGIILIGNEGKGISKNYLKLADHEITIPKSDTSKADSLNAAISTGIICAVLTGQAKLF